MTERNKAEKAVILALKVGYTRTADIVRETGLSDGSVKRYLQLLRLEYDAHSTTVLASKLSPRLPADDTLNFTSQNCVIVDAEIAPVRAADMLLQVLGMEYSQALATAILSLVNDHQL